MNNHGNVHHKNIRDAKKRTKKVPSIGCIDITENELIWTQESYIRTHACKWLYDIEVFYHKWVYFWNLFYERSWLYSKKNYPCELWIILSFLWSKVSYHPPWVSYQPKLLRCRKGRSFQTIKDIYLKFW